MNFIDILYTIFIGPLELVFEIIYMIANRFIGHPGLSIIVLSLIMNLLVLPLYKRSDAMQEEARDIDAKLQKGVAHIKKAFTGDEQMMILQTYYRQNNYKPTDALNGSVSLLLQVPFFMAAYNFLSNLGAIQGVSLGPIADLGAQDALFTVGGFSINILPVVMTLVNVISSAIYLKGFPLKTKIQLYGMALFFMVFLYTSPAGLVFYWTLNNIFSLVKTMFYKFKNPKKVLSILSSIVGILLIVVSIIGYTEGFSKRKLLVLGLGVLCQFPMIVRIAKININLKGLKEQKNNKTIFVFGTLFLTVLVGLLIPSTLIAASPQEFISMNYFYDPALYLVDTLCLASGTFVVWFGVFYWVASPIGKAWFDKIVWILSGIMLTNYMFFGTDLGIISTDLIYENGLTFSFEQECKNILALAAVAMVMYFIITKYKKAMAGVLLTGVIALFGMSVLNISTINESIDEVEEQIATIEESMPHFNLSKTGQNVVVLMLDRAVGYYVPYLLDENPKLKEQFAGFTYYSNTISYGAITNVAAPSIFGGYEYTPLEMNKRDDESLVSKHNEALKLMPTIFSDCGYEVTVCDPPYANYQWIPDLSIYEDVSNVNAYITEGKFSDVSSIEQKIENNRRNFFCFSVMKTMPLCIQGTIYNNGAYNQASESSDGLIVSQQIIHNSMQAEGIGTEFMNAYNVLDNLSYMTKITSDETNTFLVMTNNSTHNAMMLQEPMYEPALYVDNTKYYSESMDRFTLNGESITMETISQIVHYQSNMAALIKLGEWFDYMRENGVYDNTRIIIVSDHAYPLSHIEDLIYDVRLPGAVEDTTSFMPLLMVKDFNSDEFVVSDEFMTNADVPTLATDDIIDNPINPFTGNEINSDYKNDGVQYISLSTDFDISVNNGTSYLASKWFTISGDIKDITNWKFIAEDCTLPDEE